MTVSTHRERAAKAPLTRQRIIEAALGIMRDEGLSRVTMRRIGAVLDTGHASLYVYVRNTEDLHAQILDALLAPVIADIPGTGTWRDRLKALLRTYGEVLRAHPEIARMALSTQPSGPNSLALVESILALLHEGGVLDGAAAWAVDLLLLYPTAIAVERSTRKSGRRDDDPAPLAAAITTIAAAEPARFPHIARLGAQLVSGDGPARSDWALDVLLDGVLFAGFRTPDDHVRNAGT